MYATIKWQQHVILQDAISAKRNSGNRWKHSKLSGARHDSNAVCFSQANLNTCCCVLCVGQQVSLQPLMCSAKQCSSIWSTFGMHPFCLPSGSMFSITSWSNVGGTSSVWTSEYAWSLASSGGKSPLKNILWASLIMGNWSDTATETELTGQL